MKDYGNLSVRSAKEQLQAIYGAKDFLRGNQQEMPDMYSYYQSQIDELSQEEDELNSWLEANGGSSIWDVDEDQGYDNVAQEEISHLNDDLYEGGADNNEPVIDNSENDLYNQNVSAESAEESEQRAALSGSIYIDPDSGESMWYSPDGSAESIDDFQPVENGEGDAKADSKTAWEIISDWVNADDGDINNGSFQTDPESGKTYYVSPDGMLTPVTEFGVEEKDVQSSQGESETAPTSADSFTDTDGKEYVVGLDGNIVPVSEIKATENSGSETVPLSADRFTDTDGKEYVVGPDGNIVPLSAIRATENGMEAPSNDTDTIDPSSIKFIDEQANGVKTVEVDGKRYYDYSKVINKVFEDAAEDASKHKLDFMWFYSMVNHEMPWDIKRENSWESTTGTEFPGSHDTVIIVNGKYTTPEKLGNLMYGYTGTAAGYPEWLLDTGSIYASKIWQQFANPEIGIDDLNKHVDEFNDHKEIKKGIRQYNADKEK